MCPDSDRFEDAQPAVERVDPEDDLPEEAENVPDDEKADVVEAQREARERAQEEQAKEAREHSKQREGDATEVTNQDNHRDEPPFES